MDNMTKSTFLVADGNDQTGNVLFTGRSRLISSVLALNGSGAVSVTGLIEATNTPEIATSWISLGALSGSGTNSGNGALHVEACFLYVRPRITAISGTEATAVYTINVV